MAASRTASVRAFRGLRYSPAAVDLADVVAPPYDVIDDARRDALFAASPYNVARLILPDADDPAVARDLLCAWQEAGVLVEETGPCLYLVEQEYTGPDGVARRRAGLVALVGVEPYGDGAVVPHERTHAGPVEGRLALLRTTRAQLSPIFLLYHDPAGLVERDLLARRDPEPFVDVVDRDGTRHRVWRVQGDASVAEDVIGASSLTIADGHHRYETALRYRAERPDDAAAAWTLAYLACADAPGLAIFPTHRAVRDVPAAVRAGLADALAAAGFDVTPLPDASPAEHALALADVPHRPALVARPTGGPALLAVLREHAVPAAALPEASEALRALDVAGVGALVLPLLGLDPTAHDRDDRLAFSPRPDAAVEHRRGRRASRCSCARRASPTSRRSRPPAT